MDNSGNTWVSQLAYNIIKPFQHTSLHPNHLTTLTLACGQISSWLFAFDMERSAWLAALLFMICVFSNRLDEELTLMTGKTSGFGHDFDLIVGTINYATLLIGIGWGLGVSAGIWTAILGFLAGISVPLIPYLQMALDDKVTAKPVVHSYLDGFEKDDLAYLIGPLTWFAGIGWFFVPFAIITLGYLGWTIKEMIPWKSRTMNSQ